MRKSLLSLFTAAAVLLGLSGLARAEIFDDGQNVQYYNSMKGKKVAFVPLSMGFDLPQYWVAAMQKQADKLGYEISIRDANWSPEVGAQALSTLIAEKPDLLIVHNPDMQVYARLLKQAMDAGITVLQVNLKSTANTDAYIGVDWYELGMVQSQLVAEMCGEGSGQNGKIAVMQGTPTNPNTFIVMQAFEDMLAEHPELTVVSSQAANWDATKAHAIATTVLKQNPDLCAYMGLWEVMDIGIAAAIGEAGLTGKVKLVTTGIGSKNSCDNIASGKFDGYVSEEIFYQVRDLNNAIKILLQQDPEVEHQPFALYTPLAVYSKENLADYTCAAQVDIEKQPF